MNKIEAIGGQAVIEGVMMKSADRVAIAVRLPNKKIKTKVERLRKLRRFWRLPVIRGFVQLILILIIGIKALSWSADQQLGKDEKIGAGGLTLTLALSFCFAVLLFVVCPFFIAKLIIEKGILFNLIDGIIRIAMFIAYIAIISQIKDIKTLFRYHGAEHKTVNCYEAKKRLTIKNIKKFSTLHPRCGTAFLLIVFIVSILIFSLIKGAWQIRLISRIILIPLVAGISYEILKITDRYRNSAAAKIISAPGLALQKLTTAEPDEKQIEVAVCALKNIIKNRSKS